MPRPFPCAFLPDKWTISNMQTSSPRHTLKNAIGLAQVYVENEPEIYRHLVAWEHITTNRQLWGVCGYPLVLVVTAMMFWPAEGVWFYRLATQLRIVTECEQLLWRIV